MTDKESSNLVLGYWRIRGLVEPSRLVLHYTNTPYEEKYYHIGDAPQYPRDAWLKDKTSLGMDFPNLPYLIETGSDGQKFMLTQSRAILRYLGRRFNLLGQTAKEMGIVDMLVDQLHDLRMEFNKPCYGGGDFLATRDEFCSNVLPRYLKEFEAFLSKSSSRKWLVGDKLTIADFQFYEYFYHCWLLCKDDTKNDNTWKSYPRIRAHMKQFEQLPELKEYLESDAFRSLPVNGRMAKFGGEVVTRSDE